MITLNLIFLKWNQIGIINIRDLYDELYMAFRFKLIENLINKALLKESQKLLFESYEQIKKMNEMIKNKTMDNEMNHEIEKLIEKYLLIYMDKAQQKILDWSEWEIIKRLLDCLLNILMKYSDLDLNYYFVVIDMIEQILS
jgi:hypothetical protein